MKATHKPSPRRRWDVKPWAWPGDDREQKAKRICRSYRQLVFDITQGHVEDPAGDLHRLDAQWAEYGHHWPCAPPLPVDDSTNDWYTAADLAHLIGTQPDWPHTTPANIYRWAREDNITQRVGPDGSPEYSLSSARAYLDRRRTRSTQTATQRSNHR